MARSKFHNGEFISMEDTTLEDELRHIKNIPDYIEVDKELEYKKTYDIWINSNRVATENEVEATKRKFSPTADTKEKTFYNELKSIEKVPDFVDIDKGKAYTIILDHWRKRHQLVDKAIKGEISISYIVSDLVKEYHHWKFFLPMPSKGKKFYRKYNEKGLDTLLYPLNAEEFFIGSTKIDNFISYIIPYIFNPITGGIAGMGFGFLFANQDQGMDVYSRAITISLLTFSGAMGGEAFKVMSSIGGVKTIKYIKKDAQYLQSIVKKYIK